MRAGSTQNPGVGCSFVYHPVLAQFPNLINGEVTNAEHEARAIIPRSTVLSVRLDVPQPILVQAEGELLRELIAGKLPAGFETAEEIDPTRGLNLEPVSVALIAAGGAVVSSLISALAVVWKAHVEQPKKESGALANASTTPTLTVSTHSDDIVIRIGRDAAAAVALAPLPTDPADVVEIRLAVEHGAQHGRRA